MVRNKLLLVKLRVGLSNDTLVTPFGFRSKQDVGNILDSTWQTLIKRFAMKYLSISDIFERTCDL